MRLHFQTTPLDLYVVLVCALVVSMILLVTGVPNVLGLALVFLVPGYLGMASLLPRADQGDWTLRMGLTFGLSLAFTAFLGIGLDFAPWGITFYSVAASELLLSMGLGALAYRRRTAVPAKERLEVTLDLAAPHWREYNRIEKALSVALVAILIIAIPLLAASLTQPRPTPGYTELYLLGPTGNFSGYPSVLNVSELGTVLVVVTDHEGVAANYTLRVDLVGVQVVHNATSNSSETVAVNRTTLATFPVHLLNDAAWNRSFSFSIGSVGTWEVQFLLFRGTDLSSPYRFIRLDVAVPR